MDYTDPDGRALPLRVAAVSAGPDRPAVSLRVTPTSLALACRRRDAAGAAVAPAPDDIAGPCPIQLATPAGAITVTGGADATAIALDAHGVLDLALIQPLLGDRFDEIVGTGDLDAEIRGPLAAPVYSVAVDLKEIGLRPSGQDTVIRVPEGFVKLDNDSLGLSDVRIRVDDTYLGKRAELSLRGLVALDGLTPSEWSLIVDGEIAGKLLLALAPGAFSQASGAATIDEAITISGAGAEPRIEGSITFDDSQPLTVVPRGVRRELALLGGTIEIGADDADGGYALDLDGVRASIDGEGTVENVTGYVGIKDGAPVSIDVSLGASGIPFRIPRTLDLVVNATDVHLLRADADAPLEVAGTLEVVSGRYIKNVELTEFLRPVTPSTSVRPFWEEYPWIGEAVLDLGVRVSSLDILSNFGELGLASNDLTITGTPRDPRVGGQITVQDGRLHIPGTRPTFTRTRGAITFSPRTKLLEGTPALAVTSEADYRDPSGQNNLITLTLTGAYPKITWDLSTSTGLTKAQTATLIFLGRTPEQLRASLGDDVIGKDPTQVDPTAGDDTTLTDQLLKEIAGDWISNQIGDELRRFLPLDVARVYITTGGFGFHGEEQVSENVDGVVDYERTVRGQTVHVRGELRTPSRLSAQVGYLDKTYDDEAEQDITDLQFKVVLRLVWD
ncbi:MAG: translocation/assembly module TamB domain-containing protein [Kofleriaceae bacterium]